MFAFLEFVAIVVVGITVLFAVLAWIKEKHPSWRNFAAFALAAGAAYAASFALDIFIGALVRVYSFSPFTLPVLTWSGIGIALHRLARFVDASRLWTAVPYLGLGAFVVAVGLFGPHKYSMAVGAPLIVFAILTLSNRQVKSPNHPTSPDSQ